MDNDVISVSIRPGRNHLWILGRLVRKGYRVVKHEYNYFIGEHFYLLRKDGE